MRLKRNQAETGEQLRADVDRQDTVSLNLQRAVQVCVDIATYILSTTQAPAPLTMGSAFEGLEQLGIIDHDLCNHMKTAVGFRNVAVHSYQEINWEIVHAITWQHLDDFRSFARAVAVDSDGKRR